MRILVAFLALAAFACQKNSSSNNPAPAPAPAAPMAHKADQCPTLASGQYKDFTADNKEGNKVSIAIDKLPNGNYVLILDKDAQLEVNGVEKKSTDGSATAGCEKGVINYKVTGKSNVVGSFRKDGEKTVLKIAIGSDQPKEFEIRKVAEIPTPTKPVCASFVGTYVPTTPMDLKKAIFSNLEDGSLKVELTTKDETAVWTTTKTKDAGLAACKETTVELTMNLSTPDLDENGKQKLDEDGQPIVNDMNLKYAFKMSGADMEVAVTDLDTKKVVATAKLKKN